MTESTVGPRIELREWIGAGARGDENLSLREVEAARRGALERARCVRLELRAAAKTPFLLLYPSSILPLFYLHP
jgi:hypothetical protein